MTTQDAAEIAASIDVTTVAGHNLRALLLRRADDCDWFEPEHRDPNRVCEVALGTAQQLALINEVERLTPLGREVAELLRPKPWTVSGASLCNPVGVLVADFPEDADDDGLPHRIAATLTADDLRAAKTYRIDP